ncbi:MAG TPA: lipopolysaccharide biosynthesis protein [Pirellulales bacterium]|nr:lipopolysaccharide biosynthesis protein [Pirellulales bacterium]
MSVEEIKDATAQAVAGAKSVMHDMPPGGINTDVTSAAKSAPGSDGQRRGLVRRVVGGTFNYGLGQSIPKFIQLLLLPVYTRILSPMEYGGISLSIQFGGFIMALMRQGVPGAVARYYYDHDEGPSLRDYVTTVAWYLLGSSLLVALVATMVSPWLLGYLVPGLPLPLAFLAILSGIAYCNGELQSRLVQAREQSSYQARLNVGRASISIVLAILLVVVLRWGALGVLSAEVVSYGVLGLVAIWYLRAELRGHFRRSMLKSSLSYGWGMMPGDFVGNLTPFVTGAVLSGVQTTAANGLFYLALRVTQPLTMLGLAFQTAYNPVYFSVRKEGTVAGLDRLAVTARNVWAAAVAFAIAAALMGPPLVVLVTPGDYHAAAPLVPIFAVGFLGMTAYNLLGPEIFFSKRTWLMPVIVYGSAAIEIAIAVLTVKTYGAAGVAWGSAARMLMSALVAGVISCRLVEIPYSWFSMIRIAVCGAAAYLPTLIIGVTSPFLQLAIGMGGVAVYMALLWLTGDPSVREVLVFVRRQIDKRVSMAA